MRAAKWIAISLGGLFLLLGIAVFVITQVIDPNRYRARIESMVSELTGRPFTIEGRLSLTWYPWLGITMGAAHLDNLSEADTGLEDRSAGSVGRSRTAGATPAPASPSATSQPLITWKSLSVAAKLLPLLKGQVIADRIRLDHPQIHLHRDARGHGNWEGLGSRKSSTAGSPSAQDGQGTPPPQIAGLELRDGTLDYTDDKTHKQYTLTQLQADIGEWKAGNPLPVTLAFTAHGGTLPASGVPVTLDVPQLAIKTDPLNLSATTLQLKIAGASLEGGLGYAAADDQAHGDLKMHVPSVRTFATDLALAQSLPPDPTVLGALELTGAWSYAGGEVSAKPLSLSLDGIHLTGWLARSPAPIGEWRFELRGDKLDLAKYRNPDSAGSKPFELPTATLKAINANGSVVFDEVLLADTRMANVRLQFQTPESTP